MRGTCVFWGPAFGALAWTACEGTGTSDQTTFRDRAGGTDDAAPAALPRGVDVDSASVRDSADGSPVAPRETIATARSAHRAAAPPGAGSSGEAAGGLRDSQLRA